MSTTLTRTTRPIRTVSRQIVALLDPGVPLKDRRATGEALVEPAFYDEVADTFGFIVAKGALEVEAQHVRNGDLLRLALTAGWSSRTGQRLPAWIHALDVFFAESTVVQVQWEIVEALLGEEG